MSWKTAGQRSNVAKKQIPPTAASNIHTHTQKNSINTPAPKPNCFLYNKIQTEYYWRMTANTGRLQIISFSLFISLPTVSHAPSMSLCVSLVFLTNSKFFSLKKKKRGKLSQLLLATFPSLNFQCISVPHLVLTPVSCSHIWPFLSRVVKNVGCVMKVTTKKGQEICQP